MIELKSTSTLSCRICSNKDRHNLYAPQEMQFGTREVFSYFVCKNCGCLQIADVPKDLDRFYPKNYYSFQPPSKLSRFLKRRRAKHLFSGPTLDGFILQKLFGEPYYATWLSSINFKNIKSILDIGCGAGVLIDELSGTGIPRILGIDPFIDQDRNIGRNCRIEKKTIFEVKESFDLIMMHDSLEHLSEQKLVLDHVRSLMHKHSILLVRIPVLGFAWQKYGIHWANLDAPRHLYLHSAHSFKHLALQSGLSIFATVYDSTETQFILSEQYLQGIDQTQPQSYAKGLAGSGYTAEAVEAMLKQAAELNRQNEGDHAAFYLKV